MTVAVLLAVLAFVNGLHTAFQSSGNPLQILVMRKGATAELSSAMTRENFPGFEIHGGHRARRRRARWLRSKWSRVINLPSVDSPDRNERNAARHACPSALRCATISSCGTAAGSKPDSAKSWWENPSPSVIPALTWARNCAFGRGEWEVVGVMDGGQSSVNSEIFGDLNQISSDFNRADGLSSVLLRATDPATVPALINSLNDDRRLGVVAQTEKSYYESQTNSGAPLQFLGIFISIIMAVGSSFAAMNTMYAAVARRATRNRNSARAGFFARRHPAEFSA